MSARKKTARQEPPKPTSFTVFPTPGSPDYDTLLSIFGNPESEANNLTLLLGYLDQHVSRLDADYKNLVLTVMNMNWLDRGPELQSAFTALTLNIVSAHMTYTHPCLRMLVKKFHPASETTETDVNNQMQLIMPPVHSLLKSITEIVPMALELLPQILESLFPYIDKNRTIFKHYTSNLLRISSYLPSLRQVILELVISNMLKLDVRIPRVDINTALLAFDDDADSRDGAMFDMEEENISEDASKPKEKDVSDRLAEVLPYAGTLDVMMDLCFTYIRESCYVLGKLDWEVTKRLYRELLWIFDKFIFPTHESCHVQFLMLYICSFKEALCDGFIDYLWKKVTDPTSQAVYRQTAACYIGSFVTRASFLPLSTSKQVVELMLGWVHTYLDQTGETLLSADVEHHGPFYSVCQSAFYIFCFLHNHLLQAKNGQRWGESLNLQRIITSSLNPLRVCMPIVVKTFASASRMHQLAFCDTIIERNNRYTLPVAGSTFELVGSRKIHLESYFPFDPYLLPGSSKVVLPLYREFHGSLPDVDVIEEEDEDDFFPEEERRNADIDIGAMLGKSPVDLLHYSISPGFEHT